MRGWRGDLRLHLAAQGSRAWPGIPSTSGATTRPAPTAPFQRFCNRQLLLPDRSLNCHQLVVQGLAALPCGLPLVLAQAWGHLLQHRGLPVAPAVQFVHEHRGDVLEPEIHAVGHGLRDIPRKKEALLQDVPGAETEEQRELSLRQILDLVHVQEVHGPLSVPFQQPVAVHVVHYIEVVEHAVDLLILLVGSEQAVHVPALLGRHPQLMSLMG